MSTRGVAGHRTATDFNTHMCYTDDGGRNDPGMECVRPTMQAVRRFGDRAARVRARILVTRMSGVRNGVLARRIHALSARASKPFLATNCAKVNVTVPGAVSKTPPPTSTPFDLPQGLIGAAPPMFASDFDHATLLPQRVTRQKPSWHRLCIHSWLHATGAPRDFHWVQPFTPPMTGTRRSSPYELTTHRRGESHLVDRVSVVRFEQQEIIDQLFEHCTSSSREHSGP